MGALRWERSDPGGVPRVSHDEYTSSIHFSLLGFVHLTTSDSQLSDSSLPHRLGYVPVFSYVYTPWPSRITPQSSIRCSSGRHARETILRSSRYRVLHKTNEETTWSEGSKQRNLERKKHPKCRPKERRKKGGSPSPLHPRRKASQKMQTKKQTRHCIRDPRLSSCHISVKPTHPIKQWPEKQRKQIKSLHRFFFFDTNAGHLYTPLNSLTTRNHMAPRNLNVLSAAMLHSTVLM